MEIKAELNKPFTSDERTNFIVQQNHRNGYTIQEATSQEDYDYYIDNEIYKIPKLNNKYYGINL